MIFHITWYMTIDWVRFIWRQSPAAACAEHFDKMFALIIACCLRRIAIHLHITGQLRPCSALPNVVAGVHQAISDAEEIRRAMRKKRVLSLQVWAAVEGEAFLSLQGCGCARGGIRRRVAAVLFYSSPCRAERAARESRARADTESHCTRMSRTVVCSLAHTHRGLRAVGLPLPLSSEPFVTASVVLN
eukprot:6181413-Pleurochrysis_carterae.AAC.1